MGCTDQNAGESSTIQHQEVKVGDAKQEGSPNGERQGDNEHQMQCEGTVDEVHKETEEKKDEEDTEGSVSDSFINGDEDYDDSDASESADGVVDETPLTDAEVEELISELLVAESEAAEAQESLEEDSLKVVEKEVRDELAQTLQGDELEAAVVTEMNTFSEQWKMKLSDLETEIALLLEQLDGAGIELPSVYKWIESQAPKGCSTEAWIKRVHWAGSAVSSELSESVSRAEEFLQSCHPVKRQHGKLFEVGASGFLSRKLAHDNNAGTADNSGNDWNLFNQIICPKAGVSFGGKTWASVYLASTPQEAASMGLKCPGVDEVEEIDEVQNDSCDPFYAIAVANEKDIDLSEEQRRNFRKVREEDDEKITKKLQNHLKRRRYKKHHNKDTVMMDACAAKENGYPGDKLHGRTNIASDMDEKQLLNDKDTEHQHGRPYTVILDSDEENVNAGNLPAGFSKRKSEAESSPQSGKGHIIDVDAITTPKLNGLLPAAKSNARFHCTICLKDLPDSKVDKHPLLEVIVCQDCKSGLEERMDFKGAELDERCCSWCGKYDDLVSCSTCTVMFCSACVGRNLGEEQLRQSKTSTWRCCICLPILLHKLILEYNKAFNSVDVSSGSERSDSEASVSKRRKRKKRIRRILDDEELREETKQKIELEKARQEHLISMKPSGYSCNKVYDVLNGLDGESTEVLGDASTGYIVNFAREEGEDPVRIPPSISSWLKPHQVAGVRFMWQNIVQSVKKVKSGDKGLGCILAHTMGLGKTFQVITFLYTAMRVVDLGLKTALVVMPVNVLHNWKQEFVKWKPSELKQLRVFMLEDVPRDRRLHLLSKWSRKGGVLLIGYAAFRNLSFGRHVKDRAIASEMCHLLQRVPDILVCDEAHLIKNTKTDITQALKQIKTQRRIALTGSPLQNNLMEYFCMVDFVREGYLGSSHEFRNRFQNPIEHGQDANSTSNDVKIMNQRSHILYEQLKGFVQRVDLNVVKNDLPPKTVYVISVKLSPLQRKLYKRFLDVHGFTKESVSSGNLTKSRCFFAGYQALARIWNHPGLLQTAKDRRDNRIREDVVENISEDEISSDDMEHSDFLYRDQQIKNESVHQNNSGIYSHETETIHMSSEINWWEEILEDKIDEVDYSGKMVLLLDILSMSSEVGDKVLIFSQSLATLDLIELFLSKLPRKEGKLWKRGKDWYRLDGRTVASERQKLVEKFNDLKNKRVKCTLISTRAGSLGINLYAANRVVLVDGSWNPTNDLQAIYRVWRYGQIKPVYAYRLMAHGTMEEKIYKRQVTKEGLAARVVDRQQIYRTMSKEEILHLFEFGDDDISDALTDRNQGSCDDRSGQISSLLSQTTVPFSNGVSDKLMENILSRHYPRWVYDYHEHEMLLQENEEERLSKEEQDLALEAWEAEIREWEEVHRTMLDGSPMAGPMQQVVQFDSEETVQVMKTPQEVQIGQSPTVEPMPLIEQKLQVAQVLQDLQRPQVDQRVHLKGAAQAAPKPPRRVQPVPINKADLGKSSLRNTRPAAQRKCSNLSHLLTLRSQGTKAGCSTICGECLTQISWENLNRDGRPR